MSKKTVYIFSSGELRRRGNTLYFEGEGKRKYLPVEGVAKIQVFGEISLNKKILEFLSRKEIILSIFSHHGYYMGSFYPREHYNSGFMILRQAEHYLDGQKRLLLARAFVLGAMQNIEKVIAYYRNRGVEFPRERIEAMEALFSAVDSAASVEELMALEGNFREAYYKCFDQIITRENFKMGERSRRPPQNRLNALISFGNSLLYTEVLSEIYKTHLDPRIGFLHATNFRRFSLNLDVAEVFKPIIVDRLIFTLVNKEIIKERDFDRRSGGVFMKESAMKKFAEKFEEKMATTIKHRGLGRNVSYRRLIRLELYKLEKHLMQEEQYKPFVARW